jgi:peptide-methionine (R)-S-oxide reductase
MRTLTPLAAAVVATALTACVGQAGANDADDGKDFQLVIEPQRNDDGGLVPVEKTKEQWKQELSDKEFHILREHGTERAGTGRYLDNKKPGVYACAGCGLALFSAETKYESGTGWPSFFRPFADDHVKEIEDNSYGMRRVEVRCARCDGHLGHVFPDGPQPTGQRYCLNGYALNFADQEQVDATRAAAASEEPSGG